MRISDCSSDVCCSDLIEWQQFSTPVDLAAVAFVLAAIRPDDIILEPSAGNGLLVAHCRDHAGLQLNEYAAPRRARLAHAFPDALVTGHDGARSEEHTSELQSLMRITYAVFCLKKKKENK